MAAARCSLSATVVGVKDAGAALVDQLKDPGPGIDSAPFTVSRGGHSMPGSLAQFEVPSSDTTRRAGGPDQRFGESGGHGAESVSA
jgi:hypothetical protein